MNNHKRQYISREEWVLIAERLVADNNGMLPSVTWLKENGYNTLYCVTRRCPELFVQFKRARCGTKSQEKWVPMAKKLAEANENMLPSMSWLAKNGYNGLYQAVMRYPNLFKDIKRARCGTKSREKWVIIAEKLVEENGNMLPTHSWLIKNGYNGLCYVMQRHPQLFAQFKQKRLTEFYERVHEEWVLTAEKLAANNNGMLPPVSWLNENGYHTLYAATRRHPELFAQFKQEKYIKSREEWVLTAEKLAVDNNGVLPSVTWLKENGYTTLIYVRGKHPALFAHIKIKQERHTKSPQEWVIIAEKLTADNNGRLPSPGWLQKNGHRSLAAAIDRHPKLFAHIKQERHIKSPQEWVLIAEKLAADNNGTLPLYSWLQKNGYSTLKYHIKKHPALFAHIKWNGRYNANQ